MSTTVTVDASEYEDFDDCLAAAAAEYTRQHPDLAGWDLAPAWSDESRNAIILTVPAVGSAGSGNNKRLYSQVDKRDVPDGLIWHTPRQFQNQAIEVRYAHGHPQWRSEAGDGSRWKSEVDHSIGPLAIRYYRLVGDES